MRLLGSASVRPNRSLVSRIVDGFGKGAAQLGHNFAMEANDSANAGDVTNEETIIFTRVRHP